eukprot:2657101-Rhodomonas_salina.1
MGKLGAGVLHGHGAGVERAQGERAQDAAPRPPPLRLRHRRGRRWSSGKPHSTSSTGGCAGGSRGSGS